LNFDPHAYPSKLFGAAKNQCTPGCTQAVNEAVPSDSEATTGSSEFARSQLGMPPVFTRPITIGSWLRTVKVTIEG